MCKCSSHILLYVQEVSDQDFLEIQMVPIAEQKRGLKKKVPIHLIQEGINELGFHAN